MPVSNISVVGVRFSTSGASRWIGQRVSASTGSPRSIGSPSRLKIRPSVPRPTGTVIGPPVSTTSMPRLNPSVVSMATARTRSSPRCCWTSQTSSSSSEPALTPSSSSPRFASVRLTVIALLISGSSSGKTASITTPVISSMRPTLRLVCGSVSVAIFLLVSRFRPRRLGRRATSHSGQRFCAGDDFHDLLGDLRLARAVHLQSQVLDELAGVLGGVAHRGHARAVLGGGGLQQGAVDRDLHVVGHQALEDLLRVGLVLDERARAAVLLAALLVLEDRRLLERQQRLAAHGL